MTEESGSRGREERERKGTPLRRGLAVTAVLFASGLAALMQTFQTVNLPTIAVDLGSTRLYGWVPGLYLATSTLFIPAWASLSDRFGPRWVHFGGLLLGLVGLLGLVVATSGPLFLAARALQGVGAAAVVPASLSALAYFYGAGFGRMIGALGAVQATATLAGGPLGGWLGADWGWRGSLGFVAAFSLLPVLVVPFALPTWTRRSERTRRPQLLRHRSVVRAIAVTMTLAVVAFGLTTYLPLLLRAVHHLDLGHTSLLATPTLVGVAIGSIIGGRLTRWERTDLLAWSAVLVGLAVALIPASIAAAAGSALAACGVGIGLPRQLVVVQEVATLRFSAAAAGVIQAARNTGGALGVVLLGLPLQLGSSTATGASLAYVFMAVTAVTAMVASATIRP